jgi:hypothetical protein
MPKRHTNAVFLGDLRGRTAGKIAHLERIAAEVAASLAAARGSLEAIDRVIALFDPRIDPATLPVIMSTKRIPRGPRGGLTLALEGIMEAAGSEGLSSREVAWALQVKHGLVFETPQEFNRFLRNVLRCRLQDLEKMGLLEGFEDPTEVDESSGRCSLKRWRLKQSGTSIDSLVDDARACGAEVIVVDAEVTPPVGNSRRR